MTLNGPVAEPALAQPAFHIAPVLLDEPTDDDRIQPMTSADFGPRRIAITPELSQLSTKRLTRQIMEQLVHTGTAPDDAFAQGSTTDPMVTASTVAVYTPAQIRAAYGLPALSSATFSLTSAQAAQLGAGQTIYIVDA